MGREHMNKHTLATFRLWWCPEAHLRTIYSLNVPLSCEARSGNEITEMWNLASWISNVVTPPGHLFFGLLVEPNLNWRPCLMFSPEGPWRNRRQCKRPQLTEASCWHDANCCPKTALVESSARCWCLDADLRLKSEPDTRAGAGEIWVFGKHRDLVGRFSFFSR